MRKGHWAVWPLMCFLPRKLTAVERCLHMTAAWPGHGDRKGTPFERKDLVSC